MNDSRVERSLPSNEELMMSIISSVEKSEPHAPAMSASTKSPFWCLSVRGGDATLE